jgi:hypothetical protein
MSPPYAYVVWTGNSGSEVIAPNQSIPFDVAVIDDDIKLKEETEILPKYVFILIEESGVYAYDFNTSPVSTDPGTQSSYYALQVNGVTVPHTTLNGYYAGNGSGIVKLHKKDKVSLANVFSQSQTFNPDFPASMASLRLFRIADRD